MRTLEVSLIEWPDGPNHGGPRLLGRTTEPGIVTRVQAELAAQQRERLSRLEPNLLHAVPDGGSDDAES
jgi:hypothetical protein